MTAFSLDGVFAGVLAAASIAFEPGLNVVLGASRDGTDTLARLAAGLERPRRGTLALGGRDPWRSPELRARVGVLLAEEPAASAPSVRAWVQGALSLRGSRRSADALLDEHGLSSIASSLPERVPGAVRRHVALALALGVDEPLALVLHEPFAVGPLANREQTRRALLAAAESGACVIVLTASPRDASVLGGRVVLLDGGRFVRRMGPSLSTELAPGHELVLRVRSPEARRLAAQLSSDPSVTGVEWSDAQPEVTIRGADASATALAVMGAARALDAPVVAMEPVLPALDVARAASQGLWRAAYEAAYRLAQERAGARVIARSAAIGEGAARPASAAATGAPEPGASRGEPSAAVVATEPAPTPEEPRPAGVTSEPAPTAEGPAPAVAASEPQQPLADAPDAAPAAPAARGEREGEGQS